MNPESPPLEISEHLSTPLHQQQGSETEYFLSQRLRFFPHENQRRDKLATRRYPINIKMISKGRSQQETLVSASNKNTI